MDLICPPGFQPETHTQPPGQLAPVPPIRRTTPPCVGCGSPILSSDGQKAAAQEGVPSLLPDSPKASESSCLALTMGWALTSQQSLWWVLLLPHFTEEGMEALKGYGGPS